MHNLRGILLTLLGASLWGYSGACGQYLFANYTIDASYLTALRMFAAGVILTAYSLVKHFPVLKELFSKPKTALQLVIFALPGLAACQYTYLKTISYTNAGTATVLQYLMPVLILIYVCLAERRNPRLHEYASVLLASLGVFILATHGNPAEIVISPEGLAWGLASAGTAALYTLLPRSLMSRFGSVPVVGCGMLIGGLVMGCFTRLWEPPALDAASFPALFGIVILGTVVAFTLYLLGVSLVGPVKASLLASAEPVAATVLAVFWLGSAITAADLTGFAAIIAAVFILTLKK